MDSSIFWDSMLFVVAGIFLMFFVKPWNEFIARWAAARMPAGTPPKRNFATSPIMVWVFRFVGLISLVFGGLGVWLATGHAIPSLTG